MFAALIGPIANLASSWMESKVEKVKADGQAKVAQARSKAAVADKIAVLKDGEIVQQGTTESFYKKPKNLYVASLFCSIVKLTNYDLEYFGYSSGIIDNTYAISFNNFEINKDCHYSTNLIILKSKHFRDIFLNTALLPNNKHLNFYSDINLSEKEVNVGFNKESLLVFNKDFKD